MFYQCAQPVMIVGARNKRECGLAATGALNWTLARRNIKMPLRIAISD